MELKSYLNKMKILIKGNFPEYHKKRLINSLKEDQLYFILHDDEITSESAKCHLLVSYGDGIDKSLINQLNDLVWIHVLSAGMNLLPIEQIRERNILLTNVGGIHKVPMAEYTLSVILNLTHRMYHYYDLQKKRCWESWIEIEEAYGKTVGIIGLGNIGSEIAKYCKLLSMNVIGTRINYNKPVSYVDHIYAPEELNLLLQQSDFVVLTVPLTNITRDLISYKQLNEMKKTAYLINISRGGVVNENALVKAIFNKEIAGAVLDIVNQEPLQEGSVLWSIDNLFITPHISGRSPEYLNRAFEIMLRNIDLYKQEKELENKFDFNKGY